MEIVPPMLCAQGVSAARADVRTLEVLNDASTAELPPGAPAETGRLNECRRQQDCRGAFAEGESCEWRRPHECAVCALRDPSRVGFGCCAFAGNGWTFAAGTQSAPEETLRSRGVNLALVWEGVEESSEL